MELQFEMRREYLCVTVTGVFSMDEVRSRFPTVLETSDSFEATKVLIDCRQLSGSPSTMDYFSYGELIAEQVMKRSRNGNARPLSVAHVAHEPLLDKGRLSQLVANNRGASMFSTDNFEEALKWLNVSDGAASSQSAA